jgi:hypothetical protein
MASPIEYKPRISPVSVWNGWLFRQHTGFGTTPKLCLPDRHWSMEPDAHYRGLPQNPSLSSGLGTVSVVRYILGMVAKAKAVEQRNC